MFGKIRFFRGIIAIALAVAMLFVGITTDDIMYKHGNEGSDEALSRLNYVNNNQSAIDNAKGDNTIILWYADDALTEFLSAAALSFKSETGIRVKPVLVSGVELLEQINHASVYEGEVENGEVVLAPDLYITPHDNLMKAYLSGIACEISDPKGIVNAVNYPNTSIHAVSCKGVKVAYPLYYETNFFLYNKTYMANIAKQRIDSENGDYSIEETGEAAGEDTVSINNADTLSYDEIVDGEDNPMGEEEGTNDPLVLEKLANMIPATIDDILTFANNYDAPEEVEAVFKWDVSDIFYNYFFIGNYVDVGGVDGDDNKFFNIYNEQAVDCLSVYQNINQFFSIDSKSVTYDSILNEFIEGKTVFTVATTDALAKIKEAKSNGEFNYEYGVAVLPDISQTLKARGLSETSSIAINGYSKNKEAANDFAQFLSYNRADELYRKTGKIACFTNVEYEDTEIENIMTEYEKSVPLPKMVEASNYWVQLEIAFTKIWNGADADETLKELNDTIGSQIDEIDYEVPTQEMINVGAD